MVQPCKSSRTKFTSILTEIIACDQIMATVIDNHYLKGNMTAALSKCCLPVLASPVFSVGIGGRRAGRNPRTESVYRWQRPRLGRARRKGFHARQRRPRYLELERRHHCITPASRSASCARKSNTRTSNSSPNGSILESGGNSGIFVWTAPEALNRFETRRAAQVRHRSASSRSRLREQYEKKTGKKSDWFTTNGDVFTVGTATMKPFPPRRPDGSRSFPRKNLSQGRRRVEPLLRPRHQRRNPPVGQRRRSLRRQQLRPAPPATCASNPKAPVEFKGIEIRELP